MNPNRRLTPTRDADKGFGYMGRRSVVLLSMHNPIYADTRIADNACRKI